jgi:myo-inositol 2-dehydrogenase / D-chiro-inositol 1-dehydrogenase
MRVAVIGAGRMGSRHAALLAERPEVAEVLVCDADPERARAIAAETGGRALPHDEALDAADAVIVATPADLHAGTVRAAIDRRLPALCEKPLTEDLAGSLSLVRHAEQAGALVQVGFHRRHDPGFVGLRRELVSGSAGVLHLLRLTAFDPRVPQDLTRTLPAREAAPMFLHSSIHDFDFVRWLTGDEVIEVSAEGNRRDGTRPDDPHQAETAVVIMRLAGGPLAVLEATWLHPSGYDSRVEIVAERLHLSAGLSPATPARQLDWPEVAGSPWSGYLQRYDAAYRAELAAFLAAGRGEQPPSSTARDGLEALRIAIAATRSMAERRAIPLDEVAGARW